MTNPSDPTPEHPGMADEQEPAAHPGTPRESEAEEPGDSGGQVSETGGLNAEPVSDGDVADDGGPIGPDANYNAGARNT